MLILQNYECLENTLIFKENMIALVRGRSVGHVIHLTMFIIDTIISEVLSLIVQ